MPAKLKHHSCPMLLLAIGYQVNNCPQNTPYLLNGICTARCNDVSIVDLENNCLSECIGQPDGIRNDQNGNQYKQCRPCPDDRPFYNSESGCVRACPSTNMADSNRKCLSSCSGFRQIQTLTTPAGSFSYYLCIQCSTVLPLFNPDTQSCTASCGSADNINYVDESGQCTDQCALYEEKQTGNVSYRQCTTCPEETPFLYNGQCSSGCGDASPIMVTSDYTCTNTCQGITVERQYIGSFVFTLCRPCPVSAPFWDGSACATTCEQQFGNLPVVDANNVCTTCDSGYYNMRELSNHRYYQCTTNCLTNDSVGRVCRTCAEIDPARPFMNGPVCSDQCNSKISGVNVVTTNGTCPIFYKQSNGYLLKRYLDSTFASYYFQIVPECPSNSTYIDGIGAVVCRTCAEQGLVEFNGECKPQCGNAAAPRLVDINNICIEQCATGNNVLTYNTFDYCLPACNFYNAMTMQCVDTCDQENQAYYGENIKYCFSDCQAGHLKVQTTNTIQEYLQYQCRQLASCPDGYKQVRDICLRIASCGEYVGFCNSSECSSYRYDTGGVCDSRCLGASILGESDVCQICPSDQQYVENGACVSSCSQGSMIEDQKCVRECTIFKVNNMSVLQSASSNICEVRCDTFLYQAVGAQYYLCQDSCALTTDQRFYRKADYLYNHINKQANVCTSACTEAEGGLVQVFGPRNETQCLICHSQGFVNNAGSCLDNCNPENQTTHMYDRDGYCSATCTEYVYNTDKCYRSCADNNLFVASNNRNCTDQCADNEHIVIGNNSSERVCTRECPAYSQEGICVASCNDSYPFILNSTRCTSDCGNALAPILTDLKMNCIGTCNEIVVERMIGHASYYVCVDRCDQLGMRQYNSSCYQTCAEAEGQNPNTTLYAYNAQCITSCPSGEFQTNETTGEKLCIGLTQEQKLGIGLGVFFAVVVIAVIIAVVVVIVIRAQKGKLKFKYPLPASPTPANKRSKSPVKVDIGELQKQVNSQVLDRDSGQNQDSLNVDALAGNVIGEADTYI